jgi:hypothetical protein
MAIIKLQDKVCVEILYKVYKYTLIVLLKGNQLTGYVGFDMRYDNPYYSIYKKN